MATVILAPPPILQFFNNQGQPNVGGSILTQVGGVNFAAYQDAFGTIPFPNPIPLNSRGEISNAAGISSQLFLVAGYAYSFTHLDALGNQISQASYVATLPAPNITFATRVIDTFVGDGVKTVFTLSASPGAQSNIDAEIGGVDQAAGIDFTWLSGSTITFASPPPNLVTVRVKYLRSLPMGTSDANVVQFTPTYGYAVGTVGYQLQQLTTSINSAAAGLALLANLYANPIPARALGVPVFSSSPYFAFGDSYTAGTGSAGYNCYAAIIGSTFNSTFTNCGISGTGVTKTLTQAWANLPKWHLRGTLITWMAGFNDLHFNGGGTATLQKIREGARAFMANAFLKQAWAADDTTVVTQTGVWTNATPAVWGDKASAQLGGHAMFSGLAATKLSFAFTGNSVVVGTWSGKPSSYTLSPVDIYIDSVFVENYTPNNTTDGNVGLPDTYQGLTHTARVYAGLGSGAHTIEVRVTTNNYVMVDYFGTLAPPAECPSLLMAGVVNVDATGYSTLEIQRTPAIDASASAVIQAEVNTFAALGYPVAFVSPNDYYNPATQIFTDHDHPNASGHKSISGAFISRAVVAPIVSFPSASFKKNVNQTLTTGVGAKVSWTSSVDDRQGFWLVANATKIIAPSTGTMRLAASIIFAANATGSRSIDIFVNGAIVRQAGSEQTQATNTPIVAFCCDVAVNAGDYVELNAGQNSGGNLDITSGSQLDVQMVR